MLKIPHCLHSGLTEVGEVVNLTHRQPPIVQKHKLYLWWSFLLGAKQTPENNAAKYMSKRSGAKHAVAVTLEN